MTPTGRETKARSYLIGLIGAGIRTSLSPALHEAEARHHGLAYVYRLLDTELIDIELLGQDVGELIRTGRLLGFDGLNVTHPYKQTVIPHLTGLSAEAAGLGAVNTVVFDGDQAIGHNTDWSGFVESFARGLPDAPTRRVVQLGAGGAGAAVAHGLLVLRTEQLTIVDIEPERAVRLAAELNDRFGGDRSGGDRSRAARARAAPHSDLPELLAGADGLVHATPTGMENHPGLPLPIELLHKDLWLADIVYRPLETELLRSARALDCRTLDGGGMVVFQAAHAFRLFTGRTPDVERMLAHWSELVGADE